jgi:hypothetical protein
LVQGNRDAAPTGHPEGQKRRERKKYRQRRKEKRGQQRVGCATVPREVSGGAREGSKGIEIGEEPRHEHGGDR